VIRTEDKELAEFSLTEGCIAVPVELYQPVDGELCVTVYPGLERVADEFLRLFSEDPFSDEAIEWLKKCLTPFVGKYGMSPSRDADVYFLDYRMRERPALAKERLLSATELIDGSTDITGWKNATTHELEMDPDDPDDACAVYRVGNTIAAYAALNDFPEEENVREIHVECAPAYRGKGYATSCTVCLSAFLLERGYSVKYVCRHTNLASARVAEKAGFTLVGRKYSFVCYRNED
jgi:RimJ/RimL family protein N-acetyltransferase